MRSYIPIEDTEDIYERQCKYTGCSRKTFYTTNKKAMCCSDSHRQKHHHERHKEKNDAAKAWNKGYIANHGVLQRLYQKGITKVTPRELEIAGFDIKIRKAAMETIDKKRCYKFYGYFLIVSDKPSEFLIDIDS